MPRIPACSITLQLARDNTDPGSPSLAELSALGPSVPANQLLSPPQFEGVPDIRRLMVRRWINGRRLQPAWRTLPSEEPGQLKLVPTEFKDVSRHASTRRAEVKARSMRRMDKGDGSSLLLLPLFGDPDTAFFVECLLLANIAAVVLISVTSVYTWYHTLDMYEYL